MFGAQVTKLKNVTRQLTLKGDWHLFSVHGFETETSNFGLAVRLKLEVIVSNPCTEKECQFSF